MPPRQRLVTAAGIAVLAAVASTHAFSTCPAVVARAFSGIGAAPASTSTASSFTPSSGSRAAFAAPSKLKMLFGGLDPFKKKTFDYGTLSGAAAEAGRAAMKGEVPVKSEEGYDIGTFAGGCFWGIELHMQRLEGVVGTSVGYTQGKVEQPVYSDVCSGATGHTEAIQVYFKPDEVSYAQVVRHFLDRINPTTVNGQGNDFGTQYRTGIYPHTPEQDKIARQALADEAPKYDKPIAMEIEPAAVYWPAEDYHQQYLEKGNQSAAKGSTETIRCYG